MANSSRMKWPFPNERQRPWYDAFEDFVAALDASGYASREDRHIVLTNGGTITWTVGTSTVEWDSSIDIVAPITGFKWQVDAASFTLDDGELVYVTIPRAPTKTTSVVATKATQVPSTDSALLLCIRVGNRVYFRNGVQLDDGASLTGIGSGSGGGGGGTLQAAYDGGDTIALSDANGPVEINDSAQTGASNALSITKTAQDGSALRSDNRRSGAANLAGDFLGKVKVAGPAAGDTGQPGFHLQPNHSETQGTVTLKRLFLFDDTVGPLGPNSPEFFLVNGDPNGQVTAGGLGSLAFRTDGTIYRKSAAPSVWGGVGGSGGITEHFRVNGDLAGIVTPSNYVDGLIHIESAVTITKIVMTQEIDGSSGDTTVELYKRSTGDAETQITNVGTVTLASGGGDRARVEVTSFANAALVAGDRLGMKITSVQGGGPEDLTVTVVAS